MDFIKHKIFVDMKGKFVSLILLMILICGCKKTVYLDNPPQLEIVVVDASTYKVSGAQVTLFLSEDDWQSKTNLVAQKNTDINGSALFTELEELVYYFYVQKESLDNTLGVSYFATPLKINEIRIVETVIN